MRQYQHYTLRVTDASHPFDLAPRSSESLYRVQPRELLTKCAGKATQGECYARAEK